MTTSKGAPDAVKRQLLERHKDRYRKESEQFEVKVGNHWIQVDMVAANIVSLNHCLSDTWTQYLLFIQFGPNEPKIHLKPIKDIGTEMPWAGIADLIVTKMFSAPIRPTSAKRDQDIKDITALAEVGHNRRAPYTSEQQAWVRKKTIEDEVVFKDAEKALKLMFKF